MVGKKWEIREFFYQFRVKACKKSILFINLRQVKDEIANTKDCGELYIYHTCYGLGSKFVGLTNKYTRVKNLNKSHVVSKFIDHMESDHKILIGDLWDCVECTVNHRPYICLCLCNHLFFYIYLGI